MVAIGTRCILQVALQLLAIGIEDVYIGLYSLPDLPVGLGRIVEPGEFLLRVL